MSRQTRRCPGPRSAPGASFLIKLDGFEVHLVQAHVHPERADVSFSRVELNLAGGGTAVASCDASQVTVVLDDVSSVDGWIAARIVATDVANIVVGALGFSLGSGYSVEILQVTEEDGTPHVFGVRPVGGKAGRETRNGSSRSCLPTGNSAVRRRCLLPVGDSRLPASNH